MAKNKLADVTDHLIAQMERLRDEDLSEEALRAEIARAGALAGLAREITGAGALAIQAARLRADGADLPELLGLEAGSAAAPRPPRLVGRG